MQSKFFKIFPKMYLKKRCNPTFDQYILTSKDEYNINYYFGVKVMTNSD